MRKLESYGKITKGIFRITHLDRFKEALKTFPDGKYKVCIEKIYNKRSNSQNAYLWGVVYPLVKKGLIDQGFDEFKQDFENEMTHDLCKLRFLKRDSYNEDSGEVIEIIGSTKRLTTTQFMEYLSQIQKWSAEYLSVDIPDPDPLYEPEKQLP